MSGVDSDEAPFVRVVVLNWNAAWLTARCLRSIELTDYPADRLEVVLVDNASIDGSYERLTHDFPHIRTIRNEANLGFAEGTNRALRDLTHVDFVALVNNDATVEPGWLRPLVAAMADGHVGAACPKILLEAPFVDLEIGSDPAELEQVLVDGVDVTTRCLHTRRHDGVLGVPVAPDVERHRIEIRFVGAPARQFETSDPGEWRLNSLGLSLSRIGEGVERGFGEADAGGTEIEEVDGFSGGGVLLRAAMLDDVGLFDPRFFAYCEDLDLAWRARRRGWRTVVVPTSTTRHLLGASGGARSEFFFVAYFSNWLVMVLRNAPRRQVITALRNALGRTWSTRAKHGRAWARVWSSVLAAAPAALAGRRTGTPVGVEAPRRVGSRWMPTPVPPAPRSRPGGPTLVYLDVSHTLVTRMRAGIQRVVRELVRHLPTATTDVELVPIVWDSETAAFRRVEASEYDLLLRPGPPPPTPKPKGRLTRAAGRVTRGVRARQARLTARVAGPPAPGLALERLEPGAVLLDVDATWNDVTIPRDRLLPDLRRDGVRDVVFVHDILPMTHPHWFEPYVGRTFGDWLQAHTRVASLAVTNSADTAAEYETWATRAELDPPPTAVVHLGTELPGAEDSIPTGAVRPPASPLPTVLEGRRYLLVVGTIEPRKNHATLLAVYDELREAHPELHLVVVGREGWNADAVVDRLRRHASTDAHVHWFHSASDAELATLYRHAFIVVVPTLAEGFGLPVAEALGHGAVVVAGDSPAIREVGGAAAEYLDAADAAAWVAAIGRHLDDDAHHRAREVAAMGFTGRPWAETACELGAHLVAVGRSTS